MKNAMKLFFTLSVLLTLTGSVCAQKFENTLCWFDNSSGQFSDIRSRYLTEAIQPYCLYIVKNDHHMPYNMPADAGSAPQSPQYEASALVYVLPGKRLEELKRLEKLYINPIWAEIRSFAGEAEKSRTKGGGFLFTFPIGDPERILVEGKEETVRFMGVNDAKKTDYTIDFGQSPFFLSIFNAQALQMRMHIYRYYDAEADKSAMVIFQQSGLDREYEPTDELLGIAALFGELSSMLVMKNPANAQSIKDWINNSTWKDIQPDFERYFHLKSAKGGKEDGDDDQKKVPPIDVENDSTIRIGGQNGKGGEVIRRIDPQPGEPKILVLKKPEPLDEKDPESPGQRMVFPKAGSLSNGGFYMAENDTATYLIATAQSMVFGVNKSNGEITMDTLPRVTNKYNIAGAGCVKDGRLLVYQSKRGVIDVFNHQVVLNDSRSVERECMVVNSETDRVYIWNKNVLKEYNGQMKELKTYTLPVEELEITKVLTGKDGRLWISIGKGYSHEGYLTLKDGKTTEFVTQDYNVRIPFVVPYSNTTCLGYKNGLYEVPITGEPKCLMPTEWRYMQWAAMNSKGDLFVMHDNFTFERYTTKGGIRLAETYTKDLRFGKKGKMLYQQLYIDRLDNLWIYTGNDVFLWHPSGKLNGYNGFNGTITIGAE